MPRTFPAPSFLPFVFLLGALSVATCDASGSAMSAESGQFVRTAPLGAVYTIHVPESYDRRKGATLLIWLHGAGGSHSRSSRAYLSQRFKPDWIVVFPDARENGSWQDREFDRIIDVLDEVEKSYTVRRAFIGGFSRGGFYTFGFGLRAIDRFAGFLCVSGGLPNTGLVKNENADKVAVVIIHGDADDVVAYSYGVKAREAFEKAGWKDLLFFRGVPGLAHRMDRRTMEEALDWLDSNGQALNTPEDYLEYGMKMYGDKKYSRAFQALSGICIEEHEKKKWYRKAASTLRKIEEKSVSAGRKVKKLIDADRNAKWLRQWHDFDRDFNGTSYHGEVKKAYLDRKAKHDEQADALSETADQYHESGDLKGAIDACLAVRDRCYLADSDGKKRVQERLARYRADSEIARKYRHQLKGTESWL